MLTEFHYSTIKVIILHLQFYIGIMALHYLNRKKEFHYENNEIYYSNVIPQQTWWNSTYYRITKFKSHCSFQLKCPHQVVLFDWYKVIPCYLMSCLCVKGLKCPLYYKNGIAREWITTKIGVPGVYHSWTTPLETWIILAHG